MGSYKKTDFETLRSTADLRNVSDLELQWLLENSSRQTLQAGDLLFKHNSLIDSLFIVLDGILELFNFQNEKKRTLLRYQKGGILGFLPFSKDVEATTFCQASVSTELLSFPKSDFRELLFHCPELTEALVQVMVTRNKNLSHQTLQNEKMLTLGKLTAGLSHELNHPIAAIQRDNAELNRVFLKGNLNKLVSSCTGLEGEENLQLQQALSTWARSTRAPGATSKEIQKFEKEWLEKLRQWGMKDPSEAAEVFTDFGIDAEEIGFWVKKIDPEMVDTWLTWLQFLLQSQALVTNINSAAERIDGLIRAVKSFTHLDWESARKELDLYDGIRSTLSLLNHKIKASKTEVIFPKPELPVTISGSAGELNQVWTNLIDNALDAMEGISSPKLEIRIIPGKTEVSVKIADNGSGIPEEIKSRIFEPFFTTKGIGKGTGLGLDLIQHIIQKHGGKISVDSKPGETTFAVDLPIV
jgi:signal transduction histidine kinase